MEFKCTCHNSGTNSFTGKCSNCGMTKGVYTSRDSGKYSAKEFEYKEEYYWIKQINNLKRYSPFNGSELVEDIDGKYVLLSDALNLFSAEKE